MISATQTLLIFFTAISGAGRGKLNAGESESIINENDNQIGGMRAST